MNTESIQDDGRLVERRYWYVIKAEDIFGQCRQGWIFGRGRTAEECRAEAIRKAREDASQWECRRRVKEAIKTATIWLNNEEVVKWIDEYFDDDH